jgi:predicted methyltransferase
MRFTERAHETVRDVIRPGETVVDATVGNGHDTLLLAQTVGAEGMVYGFDVQEEALHATRRRLLEAGIGEGRVRLIQAGHEEMADHVRGPVGAVMFNLGYLPGGDHARTTRVPTTLCALQQAISLLRRGGVISVVCYRGHPGGMEEAAAVCAWARVVAGAEVEIHGRDESVSGPLLVVLRKC